MTKCEFFSTCTFLRDHMTAMPKVAESLKVSLCQGHYDSCARYLVTLALGKDKVPDDLFPTQITRVEKIIQAK
jgi:hypothetical protein